MKVVGTQKSQILASRIARELDEELVTTRFSRFPDGEHYLQIGSLDDRTVIVGSLTDSDALVQLLLLIDACEASENILVLPYMGYARQDKQFKPGEPISARAMGRVLGADVSRVITVQVHEPGVLTHFGVPATTLSPVKDVTRFLTTAGFSDPLILAPDNGAERFAAAIAREGRWEHDHLVKTRITGEEVRMEPKRLAVEQRTAVIVDDIISTGGTLATASRMLLDQGARTVHAVCVHGIFTGGAYALLINAGIVGVAASDTIESGYSRYSVAADIAQALKEC